jgi:putative phosphoesterase
MPIMHKRKNSLHQKDNNLVGVISDTHGLLRPEAMKALAGVSMIIHAGDIGRPEVITSLENIAPVVAVRGNTDRDGWACRLPFTEVVQVGGISLYVLHDIGMLDLNPAAAGFHAVISGHTHQPAIENRNDVYYLNPGSAGPKRFTLPVSVALLRVENDSLKAELLTLEV